jgi:hypothetical protein
MASVSFASVEKPYTMIMSRRNACGEPAGYDSLVDDGYETHHSA